MRIPNKKIALLCLSACLLSSVFAAENTVEMISDPLKLVIYPDTGNFCLYHSKADEARAYEPLYDDRSQSSVNLYSVFFNGEIFPLNNKSGKKIIISQSKTEITVMFQISMDFLATQTFSFVPSKQRSTGKLLKVVTEIQNISGEIADIGLKAMFDISLGEKNQIPLYTDLRSEIGSELLLQPVLEKDSVIFSADRGYACLFFLRNEYMTVPTSVYIANWERLVTKKWLPSYVSGRSFRKYVSSDPGLLYVWSEKKMLNRETFSVTNCIGFYDYRSAADSVTGYSAYTQQMPENTITRPVVVSPSKPTITTVYRSPSVTQPAASAEEQTAASNDQPTAAETPKTAASNDQPAAAGAQKPSASNDQPATVDAQKPAAETPKTAASNDQAAAAPQSQPVAASQTENNAAASGKQLATVQPTERNTAAPTGKTGAPKKDYRYVQELLDKIAELEKSPDSLSMEEIARLRTEVDNAIEAMQEQ